MHRVHAECQVFRSHLVSCRLITRFVTKEIQPADHAAIALTATLIKPISIHLIAML